MESKTASLTDLNDTQIINLVLSLGEQEYRVKQLRNQIFKGLAFSFEEMTDLPIAFRQALEKSINLHSLKATHQAAGQDGTIKTLFTLADGNTIESALMSFPQADGRQRYTVCVSTQAGCAIGCPFCATGQQGFKRNLTKGEIIDQVLYFANYLKNHNNKGKQETLNSPVGFKMGARNMTISTSGLVPQIKRLSREKLQVGLAVSLHVADNVLRNKLVPVNKKYPLEELIAACKEYYRATGRRVSFEYILFKGMNDSIARARVLAQLLQGLNCHVNLIAANKTSDKVYQPSSPQVILAFERELKLSHVNVTLRQPRGQDINAGCGQLRSHVVNKGKTI
jgi:23S rRNA (adenine2503-C2)-methyltransferase